MGDGYEKSKEIKHSSSSHTASANADPRMKYASADAISELVWSPRNGLSIRCTDFSYSRKAKLLSPNFFDIGQPMEVHSNSKSSQEEAGLPPKFQLSTRDRVVMDRTEDDVNQGCSSRMIGGSVKEKIVEEKDDIECKEAETNRVGSPRASGGKDETLLESAGSQEEPVNHGDKEEEEKTNTKVLDGDHVESTDENDLTSRAVAASKALEACDEAGPSGKAKGKEKKASSEVKDAESFGSVESCNSAGLQSRKRPSFEQQLILGSKRIKTLSHECLGSGSKLKHDSSFMIWISNMTKGIWRANEEENSHIAALTTNLDANGQVNAIPDQQELTPSKNTGFQSFFQSMYCPRKRSRDVAELDFPNNAKPASLQKFPCLPGQCMSSSGKEFGPVAETNITSGRVGFNQANNTFSPENKEPNISFTLLSKSKPNEDHKARGEAGGKITQCLTNRNSGLENLWISRFAPKSSFPKTKDLLKGTATKVNDSASDVDSPLGRFDNPKTVPPIVTSPRIESSEAMASTFARRLEALKQFMPSGSLTENLEKVQPEIICFYCGKKGHPLRDCLEVTDTELRDLVQNISSLNGREEASKLCIRCFQLTHWAATCPNAPQHSPGADSRAMKHAVASTSDPKLSLRNFTDVPKAVFEAVKLLRLTRTDVQKWMKTKKSEPGLEGFFLRLRLGKGEEESVGTGYHVARIYGTKEGQSSRTQTENNSLSVKVGEMTCFVESQFISNHDFLEEELKAWWRSSRRSGGGSIPLEEELSRKIQQKKMLGL